MKSTRTERTIVAVLFVVVLVTFSLAQRDSSRIDRLYTLVMKAQSGTTVVKK